ncbi:MoaD/ThiS family protein [Legionella sp. km772]|jgi:molybdopterin synthase sulfur carrier subunit|uniref:MoaD/ThiS family protein n=1 Tax=Legionella sp. km772 TaxID=2498111 RepID=UPI000F8DA097|nr:MoaD/ThiS family protein [Legionella sp. km772]
MYSYQFTEFTSSKKSEQIKTNKTNLYEVLAHIYGSKMSNMFDNNGWSKGYFSVFVNSEQISSIKDIVLNHNDEVCIVTSITGG